jgi:hypothetical protein
MTSLSPKRHREGVADADFCEDVTPLIDRARIQRRILAATVKMDAPALRSMAEELRGARAWLAGTLQELEKTADATEQHCIDATERSGFMEAFGALEVGQHVATFNKSIAQEAVATPPRSGKEAGYIFTTKTIKVEGILVNTKPRIPQEWAITNVQERVPTFSIAWDGPAAASEFRKVSIQHAVLKLLKRTPMRNVIHGSTDIRFERADEARACSTWLVSLVDKPVYIVERVA